MDKKKDLQQVKELVDKFSHNYALYTSSHSDYNETQLRVDFLNPFLTTLGWDVFNEKQAPQHLREVVHEDTVEIKAGDEVFAKKPDYALRLGAERKFFVEAKRPSVPVTTNKAAAFQVRRYGWNARLSISVLTNFEKLVIYDCRVRPKSEDDTHVARLKVYDYGEYVDKFDEIYEQLSRETVYSGQFDELFDIEDEREGTEPFDEYFLRQIERWREWLAQDIFQHNPTLTQTELNFLVQRLLNRIIFLRICEDRELEKYQALKSIQTYIELKDLFRQADKRYNSDLFDFIEDQLSLDVEIGNQVLIDIFQELYYPASPYAFSVVQASILGEIYERFLAKEIVITNDQTNIVEKDEVAASRGVVPTPKYVVDAIVHKTIAPLCAEKSPQELAQLCIADIACGSGPFLVTAYEYLLHYHLEWYLKDGATHHSDKVYEGSHGTWYLTLPERQRILCTHIFGVDLDPQAVEIARFSLLLKVLENIPAVSAVAYLEQHHIRALPNLHANIQCGNSLIDSDYFDYDSDALTDEDQFALVNPLDWETAFPAVFAKGGFDAIVGNPPYIRIQNMVRYSPYEVRYYQSDASPYTCAQSDNFDKYYLFIERALSLLKPTGRLGYIVLHRFFSIKSGHALRKLLSDGKHVAAIVHFGVQQVFGKKRTTYTCILTLTKQTTSKFTVEHVNDLPAWRRGEPDEIEHYKATHINDTPWEFVSPAARLVFKRLRELPTTLEQVANIFVGVQTSADKIYIVKPVKETADKITFTDIAGTSWAIEKAILRPCLMDVALPAFSRPQPNTYIIFPYKSVGKRAHLYTSAEMQENFPQCWAYLNAHQGALEQRSIQSGTPETWYRYGRSQSLTKFDGTPKLIWPTLSLEPRYAFDDQDIVFTGGGNGPYYGLRPLPDTDVSIHYLQAVLSHPVIEAMVRARGSAFRGDYRSHGKQFIKDLPIRHIDFANPEEKAAHDRIVELARALIKLTEKAAMATVPQQRQQAAQHAQKLHQAVQKLVSDLYRLTTTDLVAVGYGEIMEGNEE
jgi:type I restriction-modification system DNA methylase subunit